MGGRQHHKGICGERGVWVQGGQKVAEEVHVQVRIDKFYRRKSTPINHVLLGPQRMCTCTRYMTRFDDANDANSEVDSRRLLVEIKDILEGLPNVIEATIDKVKTSFPPPEESRAHD